MNPYLANASQQTSFTSQHGCRTPNVTDLLKCTQPWLAILSTGSCLIVTHYHSYVGDAGLELRQLSCAGCAGFTAAAVQAIGGTHSLVDVNLKGWMPHASVQALTALQTLHGERLSCLHTPFSHQEISVI